MSAAKPKSTAPHSVLGDDNEGTDNAMRDRLVDDAANDSYWRAKHALYYEEQLRLVKQLVVPGQKVLMIGSGNGDVLAALRPSEGLGLDPSFVMVEEAQRRHPSLRFEVSSLEAFDVGGEKFDVVVLADVIGGIHDVWGTFRMLRHVVHNRSKVVVTYFNYLWQPVLELAERAGLKRSQPVQNWLSFDDVENLLSLSGFETLAKRARMLAPIEVPLLAKAANTLAPALPRAQLFCLLQGLVARPSPSFDVVPTNYSVSIIIPARNERGNIRPAIRRTPKMGSHTEIIFVEGGSSDGTREEIEAAIVSEKSACELRFLPQPGKGKYDAVKTGFAAAKNDILMILDADLTVMPEDLPRFFWAIAEGRGDFINGSRLVYQMEDQAMRVLNLAGNKFFGAAFSYVLGQRLKDTLCGTKVMRRVDYEAIARDRHVFGDFDPFGDFDLLFGAARLGLKIVEIPVRYKARTYGETQIDRFRHGLLLFQMLAKGIEFFQLKPPETK